MDELKRNRITDFVAADQTFLPSHQGWLGLMICLWFQSQHATEELWDPAKNLCKCMVNRPHKINCDPKMKVIHSVPEDNRIY